MMTERTGYKDVTVKREPSADSSRMCSQSPPVLPRAGVLYLMYLDTNNGAKASRISSTPLRITRA